MAKQKSGSKPRKRKPFDLTGRTAVVTGAGAGIGRAIALRLAGAGACVAVVDLDATSARRTKERIIRSGGRSISIRADVTDRRAVEEMARQTLSSFGRIDILVNNAGIAGRSRPLWALKDEDWLSVLDLNLTAVFYCCRAVIRHMRKQKWGRIINVASIAGKEGNPNMIPYSASKAGVIGLTKALAKEVTRDNILVNAVSPAVIRTKILDQVTPQQVEYMTSRIPLGRVGEPDEVAAVVHFLASDDSSFVTGQCYDASGGRATF